MATIVVDHYVFDVTICKLFGTILMLKALVRLPICRK